MKENRNNQTAKCIRAIFEHREQLLGISDTLVGDCLFASYNFVTGAVRLGFNVISRLRDDAALQYLHTGPRIGGPGRPRELDGTVDIHDLRDDVFVRETVEFDGQEAVLFEFLYRDAKQNTGLEHWQPTDSDRLSFGYNASLSAVNVAREVSYRIHEATRRRLSVASVKGVVHNASLYQHVREFIEGRESGDLKDNNGLTEEIPSNLLFFGVRDSA